MADTDPKDVENADQNDLAPEDLDQVSGGAFDAFEKQSGAEFLNPQPLPP